MPGSRFRLLYCKQRKTLGGFFVCLFGFVLVFFLAEGLIYAKQLLEGGVWPLWAG